MPKQNEQPGSSLLRYLPAIYQESVVPGEENAVAGLFLGCFEEILLGEGLEGDIARIPSCLTPHLARPDFLPWLAGWVALSLRTDLPLEIQRRLIGGIVPYYLSRGTRSGLEKILRLTTGIDSIFVYEPKHPPLQIGVHSKIGDDTYLAGGPPHRFLVRVEFSDLAESRKTELLRLIREIVSLEKPAHTFFILEESRIGESRTVESKTSPDRLAHQRGDL